MDHPARHSWQQTPVSLSQPPSLPQIPYGAVYFRKSNPPPEDWARDYATAAADGMNIFRHWFLWSAIEIAPGEFDWAEYDRQLDLAADHGVTTVIAEMLTAAPEWAWREYAHARYLDTSGRPATSQMSGSCATGGFPGLCLDHSDVLALAERFLQTVAERYRDHPGLGAYDVWNECNIPRTYCYCPATLDRFRTWLSARYGTPQEVGRAWQRHSYARWEDVDAPRALGPYPEVLDWLQFRIDNAYRLMRWRVDTIRRADPNHPIMAHGIASSLSDMAPAACDEWRSAAEVTTWGFTWVASRKGSEPWKQWHAVDLVRAGAWSPSFQQGERKPFWHAEAQAGPLWMQPQVLGRPREDGRVTEPEDVRLWNMTSFAGGATGILYPRWRPLLDGPLFGAFGAYGMDGTRTPRSEMASRMARWANEPSREALWQSGPVTGDVAILVVPESQLFCYAQQGNTDFYAQCARGAYQGFFENNIQADWLHIDDLDHAAGYKAVYLPFPVHLTAATAARLRRWVEDGGTLISEGCPGYWGDRARVGTVQPHLGLETLFGARQEDVEFTPDLLPGLTFEWQGIETPGGIFRQTYAPTTGQAVGRYVGEVAGPAAGTVAAVEHRYGQGRTLLMGTFPGYGHYRQGTDSSRRFFATLLDWAGIHQHVRVLTPPQERHGQWWGLTARIHAPTATAANGEAPDGGSDAAIYLWIVNPGREGVNAQVELASQWRCEGPLQVVWGEAEPRREGSTITAFVPGRDAAVIRLG
jgi:beta-galactosidase